VTCVTCTWGMRKQEAEQLAARVTGCTDNANGNHGNTPASDCVEYESGITAWCDMACSPTDTV